MREYQLHTDEQLLLLLKDDDENAFTEIYHRYWKLLFSVAANKLKNLADAEEAVQDIFTDLWRRRAEINISYSLKSFLAGAIRYRVYTVLAAYQNQQKKLKSLKEVDVVANSSAEEVFDLKLLEEEIGKISARLPDRCKLVYQLSREAGYSNKQIARSLQISEKTVEAQITKALRHLRAVLQSLKTLFLGF